MVVVKMGQDDGADVGAGSSPIASRRGPTSSCGAPGSHLPVRRGSSPAGSRHRVAPGVAGVDEEAPLRMLDQEAQDRQRLDPLAVAEDVDLPADRPRPSRPVRCAVFIRALPVSMGITRITTISF